VKEVGPLATRYGLAAVYLLRTAQYQFCNCGALYIYACRGSTCIESTWDHGRRQMKAKKATGKKKKK
jgi:hypothetical protein